MQCLVRGKVLCYFSLTEFMLNVSAAMACDDYETSVNPVYDRALHQES